MSSLYRPSTGRCDGAVSDADYPARAHMVAVCGRAIYWLADRHAYLDDTDVSLKGSATRLLQAPQRDDGIVAFNSVREHDLAAAEPARDTPAGTALSVLRDPAAIDEVLYPPYIANPEQRPTAPGLQPPQALRPGDPLLIDASSPETAFWLDEGTDLMAAPLTSRRTIEWHYAALVDINAVVDEFPHLPDIRDRLLAARSPGSEDRAVHQHRQPRLGISRPAVQCGQIIADEQ